MDDDPLEYPSFVMTISELASATGITAEDLFLSCNPDQCDGLEITDADEEGGLNFDLYHLLDTLGEETVLGWHWICRAVEVSGPGADALHAADDDELVLEGETFWDLATQVDKTIEGVFVALAPGEGKPLLRLQAVDGSWWEVWTPDGEIHQAMLGRFEQAQFIAVD